MDKNIFKINIESTIREALELINLNKNGAIFVEKMDSIVGIITDGDLRRNISDVLTFSPRDIATLNPTSVKPTDLVSVALEKMEKSKVYAIVVIEDNKPIGLLRMHDVLRSGIK